MATVLIVAYLMIVLAMIAVILLQRSEGGGLGMGSSSTGLISVRGSANLLTRTTAILATLFFATAIGLTILSEVDRGNTNILQKAGESTGTQPATVLDALKQLQQQQSGLPVPADNSSTTPASPTQPSSGAATTPAAPANDNAATPAAPATNSGTAAPAAPTGTTTAPATTTDSTATTPAAPAADPGLAVPQTTAPATDQTQAPAN